MDGMENNEIDNYYMVLVNIGKNAQTTYDGGDDDGDGFDGYGDHCGDGRGQGYSIGNGDGMGRGTGNGYGYDSYDDGYGDGYGHAYCIGQIYRPGVMHHGFKYDYFSPIYGPWRPLLSKPSPPGRTDQVDDVNKSEVLRRLGQEIRRLWSWLIGA